jgi:hypothetical protein
MEKIQGANIGIFSLKYPINEKKRCGISPNRVLKPC